MRLLKPLWWSLACLALVGCATAHLDATPPIQSYPAAAGLVSRVVDRHDDGLRIMTLNIAHGRGDSFHQLLQSSATTRTNLDSIATLLKDSGAHVVALQEADGPSFWSGNFSHIDYLSNNGDYHRSVHGAHADGLGLSYGTALIARLDLRDPRVITFDPALSPVPKGFVVSTVSWPGKPDVEVDIVSLHLDFASESTRKQQAQELINTLQDRQRPLIVTGDFNNGWAENSTVRYICQALALTAYRPQAPGLETFPALGERLDWILVSAGIAFRFYQVIPDSVSDHRGVLAELELSRIRTTRVARAE
jgi:endonuclease/exonuclease/phosphatase family metal-dependent hydrolase